MQPCYLLAGEEYILLLLLFQEAKGEIPRWNKAPADEEYVCWCRHLCYVNAYYGNVQAQSETHFAGGKKHS